MPINWLNSLDPPARGLNLCVDRSRLSQNHYPTAIPITASCLSIPLYYEDLHKNQKRSTNAVDGM